MSNLKLVVDAWLLPLPVSLFAVCAGLLLRRMGRERAAAALFTGAFVVVFAASLSWVANGLLLPLESRYRAVVDVSELPAAPQYVVVLGSGYHPRPALPVTAALDSTGVVRLAEGVRLYRQLPQARLLLSGGARHGHEPIARGYALAAAALGVPEESMVLIDTPLDTAMEIRAIHQLVGAAPALLVTSAAHMPRAMALAQREGLQAIAAPTGNLAVPAEPGKLSMLMVSAASLVKTETAIHEYLGLLALRLGVL